MKQDTTTSIDNKKIILNTSQTGDYNGIKKKLNMSVSIYNDKITSNISTTSKNFTKDLNKEIEYTNKIRYMLIMKIMYWLVKVCKKDEATENKVKNKDDYINKEHAYNIFWRG